jgi:hypothetical protein
MGAELKLRGEPMPVVISEARYRVERRQAEAVLVFESVKVSKEWLQNLLEDYLLETALKLPAAIRALID